MKCLNAEADCKYQLKVQMLDSSEMDYEITEETRTQDLLDLVYKQLDLNENIFFGLYTLLSDGRKSWLINNRRISRQIVISSSKCARLNFGIKFYLDDPCKLREEASRYQFFLAVKKDILDGKLEVPFELSAQLFAYALQSELGDYDSEMHQNNYASHYKFQANQTRKLEEKAEELHKALVGKMPASVELRFLEEVKQLELYGTELYPLLTDKEEEEENYLALSPTGVLVLHQNSLFAHYYWSNIIGVYKKAKYFMIKVFNKDNEKTTYGFELPSKKTCKCLWRNCIEYQLFYKLIQAYFENSSQSRAPANSSQLTERFRSINLNELIVRRRKTMYNLIHNLIQHVNSLNRSSAGKERLKTDELTGINFTADEIVTYQENANYDPDEVRNEKPKPNHVEPNCEQNKNELPETGGASSFLPNGFYLVNQQQMTNNQPTGKPASKATPAMQNTLNKRRPLNAYISTPGYNVMETPSPTTAMARNRKCESVFSVRSQRSRAAYSEMAYSDHRHSRHKHCSHRRPREHHKHGRRQSGCSHRHRDYHKYEEDCLSADEFEEAVKHQRSSRSRARSYHTLCDENDHNNKCLDEFDNETNCCARNRHNGRHHRRKHRSCCLNELRYDSGPEEENSFVEDEKEETGSLCSSVHSLSKEAYCKRRHKHRKESQGSKLSLKMDQTKVDQTEEQPKAIKRSFKNLKHVDKLDCEEIGGGDLSDASDLSYCSHHSRRSRRSKGCHRSKSRCCKHSHRSSRSSCGKHHHADPYSDLLDYAHHERPRRKNLSCELESLSDDTDHQAVSESQQPNREPKPYRSANQLNKQTGSAVAPHSNQIKQQLAVTEINKFAQPINKQNHTQKASNQYQLPTHQFPNHQPAYEIANQTDCRSLPKYNTINYRAPIDTKQQIQNFLTAQNYLPNYNTITTNFMKPMHFQQPAQFYQQQHPQHQQQHQQMSYPLRNSQTRTNPINHQAGMYLNNGLLGNLPVKNEQLIDLNQSKQQIYQNLQDYLKVNEMSRFENSQRPQLPPKNLTIQNAPPLPPCKPHLGTSKLISSYASQLEDHAGPLYAKPSKMNANGLKGTINEIRANDDGHQKDELACTKQPHSINSGDSANSSLQNINTLDSGISNCYSSTSTPTQDLRCSSANKPNELSKQSDIKAGDETAASSLSSSNNLDSNLDNLDNEGPTKSLNKQIKPNEAANSPNRNEQETNGQPNEPKSGEQAKPLEYYEINAEFGPAAAAAASRANNRLLGEYHPVIMQKLKCYEISTEL